MSSVVPFLASRIAPLAAMGCPPRYSGVQNKVNRRRPQACRSKELLTIHYIAVYFIMQSMEIRRATHLGMCFGVRDAIALALESANAEPLTILGDLVHNPTVLDALAAKGIVVAK